MAKRTPEEEKKNRLRACVLTLASEDGQAAAAAHALVHVLLPSVGADIHVLAALVEGLVDGGKATEAELQYAYDTGYGTGVADGIKQAEQLARNQANNRAPHKLPNAYDMACYCQQHIDDLREKEREFILKMIMISRRFSLTPRQQKWLEDIYIRLGGT